MKKYTIITVMLLSTLITWAQADTTWKKGGAATLNFNQIGLSNWAAGGENAFSAQLLTGLFANYKKDKVSWDNYLIANYGIITANNNQDVRKNDDRLEMNSKYGQYAFGDFYYSAMVNFLTQFTDGFDYLTSDQIPISALMAPGYLTGALGMDWKPTESFSLFLSPATGKFTFVLDEDIANAGTYGNEAAVFDDNGVVLTPGQQIRSEFGASMVALFNMNLADNISNSGRLTLFNNFTDPVKENRGNVDVNFVNTLSVQATKWLTLSLYLEMIYDHDIAIPIFDENDVQIGDGPRTQLKEIFGIGLSYRIGDPKPE
jgi:hypothetical protein